MRFALIAAVAGLTLAATLPIRAQDRPVELVASTEPLTPAEQQKKFRLPPGFKIELVAAEPDVPKPINIAFDAAGRLYATCSTEYPFPAEPGKGKDRIQRIVDTNGDGVPDKVSTYASGLNIPIGVAAVHDGVLGHSIPEIFKFIERVRAQLPAAPARVFMLADAVPLRGRGAYYLYPHNVLFDPFGTSMPLAGELRPGDYIVVYRRRGVQYNKEARRVRFEGGESVDAELVLFEPGGAVFKIVPPPG